MPTRPFQSGPVALVRAVGRQAVAVPPLPDLDDHLPAAARGRATWLRSMRETTELFEAIEHASPSLAAAVGQICADPTPDERRVRRTAMSVARYLLRRQGRATPFGLFAGVTIADFAQGAQADWSGEHRIIAHPSAEWLHHLVQGLESQPELLAQLAVMANNTASVRGNRVVIPYQAHLRGNAVGAAEVSLNYTAAVQAALNCAADPVRLADVEKAVATAFPNASQEQVSKLVADLVRHRALITSLHAPSTEPDALGHVLSQLDTLLLDGMPEIAGLVTELRQIHAELESCTVQAADQAQPHRERVAERLRASIAPKPTRHPLALDVRLAARLSLPMSVAHEAERAAALLARLSAAPFGTKAWKDYHQRFYERYGLGSLVPVSDVVADHGIGFPAGYPDSVLPDRDPATSERDRSLVALAQAAALDGCHEVELTDKLLAHLAPDLDPLRVPPHLEVGVRVHAADAVALDRGGFRLEVTSVSRGAGVRTGRFLPVLGADDAARMSKVLGDLPGADDDTITAQLSFPPLDPSTAHVARAPQVLPWLISLDEHRSPADGVLTLADLAIGCDGRRLYLAAPALGKRVEAVGMHALNLKVHTPPLARFLIELGRAGCATVTTFHWGAAQSMPFLPRLRSGRVIVSPACWRLDSGDLPADRDRWEAELADLRSRRRLPAQVYVSEGDQQLPLDLDQVGHRAVLRSHMRQHGHAVLSERLAEFGWSDGREHDVTVQLLRRQATPWPPLPTPTRARVLTRATGQPPTARTTVLTSIYGDMRRQDLLLTDHVSQLLARLDRPRWWFVRYRDPEPHLRLRIELAQRNQRGPVTQVVTEWGEELHRAGLLREIRYSDSHPETGRWGSGPAWDAAEEVHRTDSRAVLAQLRQHHRPGRRALFAANSLAIASAFIGDPQTGAQWLVGHLPSRAPVPAAPREQFNEAVQLTDPRDDWRVLRAVPGGSAITAQWKPRTKALAAYRRCFPGPGAEGIRLDDVLTSLLHLHYVRAYAIDFGDEAVCQHLARSAALAFLRRTA